MDIRHDIRDPGPGEIAQPRVPYRTVLLGPCVVAEKRNPGFRKVRVDDSTPVHDRNTKLAGPCNAPLAQLD